MSAFQQALANTAAGQPTASSSTLSIRGTATGAPSGRGLATALRGAGIAAERGMDVDGRRGGGRGSTRSVNRNQGGPLDQARKMLTNPDAARFPHHHQPPRQPRFHVPGRPPYLIIHRLAHGPSLAHPTTAHFGFRHQTGRHRPRNDAPYAKPLNDRLGPGGPPSRNGQPTLAERMGRGGSRVAATLNPRRLPEGTPPILKQREGAERREAQSKAHAKLNEKLGSEEMKQWIRSRQIAPGVMDMSRLAEDAWLRDQGILPPGHADAPNNAGTVFWRLIDTVIQMPEKTHIRTLSLANNNFKSLNQLNRLPFSLTWLEALDLSDNPIISFGEFDAIRSAGEKKGKAAAGAGSLNNLTELKLNGCLFREKMLGQPGNEEKYQHEILKKFPGLLVLDGVQLNRVVFPLRRQPKVRRNDDERKTLMRNPFTYPADVQGGYMDNDIVRQFIMAFCAKYYPLFDSDRSQLLPAYSPTATISINANTLNSYSHLATLVAKDRSSRPNPISFEGWTSLPSRNFFRAHESAQDRLNSLKSPADQDRLVKWWNDRVPKTRHPLTEAGKWCFDGWVLDGEGVDTKLCAIIQGEFQELPSGTYRSFSRTFILADAPQGSPAQVAGFSATVLSDSMTVHAYLSSGAFDESRSLVKDGLQIVAPSPTPAAAGGADREALVAQMRQRTGMNAQFATMCLEQNGWEFETAIKDFERIKVTIPKEAFE